MYAGSDERTLASHQVTGDAGFDAAPVRNGAKNPHECPDQVLAAKNTPATCGLSARKAYRDCGDVAERLKALVC